MPAHRITAAESHPLTHVREVAREYARLLRVAAAKLLDTITTPRERPETMQPYGRLTPHREPFLPLEAWLTAGCIVMVLWAIGWL
jgi:hypothetical protein